jgi:UPF0716 protein FxsA
VLLLLASALIGSWLLRREGRRAWLAVRAAAEAGRTPALETVEGFLVLVGGVMMMLPGFVTDILGLLLIVPPIRRVAARIVLRRFARRLPPTVAADLMGPVRVKARRGRARYDEPTPTEPGPPITGTPITGTPNGQVPPSGPTPVRDDPPQGQGKVIEGEIEP